MIIVLTNEKDEIFHETPHTFTPIKNGINIVDDAFWWNRSGNKKLDLCDLASKSSSLANRGVYPSHNFAHLDTFTHFRVVLLFNSNIYELCQRNLVCLLSKRYPIYSIKTIEMFNVNITKYYIEALIYKNKIDVLEYLLKNHKLKLLHDVPNAMDIASYSDCTDVLDWWKNSGLPLKYSESSLGIASALGNVNILEWWKNSGLPLKYSKIPVDDGSLNGHVNVLDWWFNSGLKFKYSERALDWASARGYVNVLEWWFNSGLELKYTYNAIEFASSRHMFNSLEWWKNSGLPLKYNQSFLYIRWTTESQYIDILEWWKNSGLPLTYDKVDYILDDLYILGAKKSLRWWKQSGLPLKYPNLITRLYINLFV
jgi:hypothetical protein